MSHLDGRRMSGFCSLWQAYNGDDRGLLVLYGDRKWMDENVITIPVYATMANHLCRPLLHSRKPDSNCCWIVGAQKPPSLRLPNQCTWEKKQMSKSSSGRRCVYLVWMPRARFCTHFSKTLVDILVSCKTLGSLLSFWRKGWIWISESDL